MHSRVVAESCCRSWSVPGPDPAVEGALRLILLTYQDTCAASQVPGATALPPGAGVEAPR